jgi:two-component system chemotaxis response regulator CheB
MLTTFTGTTNVHVGQDLRMYAKRRREKRLPVADAILVEAGTAERVLSNVAEVGGLDKQVPYNRPNCGGVLWGIKAGRTCQVSLPPAE